MKTGFEHSSIARDLFLDCNVIDVTNRILPKKVKLDDVLFTLPSIMQPYRIKKREKRNQDERSRIRICSTRREQQPTVSASSSVSFSFPALKAS